MAENSYWVDTYSTKYTCPFSSISCSHPYGKSETQERLSLQEVGVGWTEKGPPGQERGPAPWSLCPQTTPRSRVPIVAVAEGPLAQTTPHFSFWLRNKTVSFLVALKLSTQLQLLLLMKTLLVAPVNVNSPLNEFTECIFTTPFVCWLTMPLIQYKAVPFFFPIGTYCLFKYQPSYTSIPWVTHFFKSTHKSWRSRWNPIKLWYI